MNDTEIRLAALSMVEVFAGATVPGTGAHRDWVRHDIAHIFDAALKRHPDENPFDIAVDIMCELSRASYAGVLLASDDPKSELEYVQQVIMAESVFGDGEG